jgi:poly(hydroxyalkanoate) granule-associated protein
MLKKAKEARAAGDGGGARDMSKSVLESSRQIWLAGLGAFARAQAEGTKVFEALVRQGEAMETKTRQAATETAGAARDAAQSKANRVQQMAGDTWDKLEKVFEDRVARALTRLGIHTQADVERLSQRVDALSDAVNRLIQSGSGASSGNRGATPGGKTPGGKTRTGRTAPAAAEDSAAAQGESVATSETKAATRAAKPRKRARPVTG